MKKNNWMNEGARNNPNPRSLRSSLILMQFVEENLPLIVQIFSGAIGGLILGALVKNASLGPLVNTLLGILGGGGVAYLGMAEIVPQLKAITDVQLESLDVPGLISAVGVGAGSGGLFTIIIGGILRAVTGKKKADPASSQEN
ncbi:MAG: hypothetical protein ACFCU3_01930 [Verrucomicrobiales bacterium]